MIAATRLALVAALALFLAGNTVGLAMGAGWLDARWRPAHAHLNLLGFVTLMIQGVAYHAVPRFAGVPFRRPRLALLQVVAAIVGVLGMAAGFGFTLGRPWLVAFGSAAWISGALFAALIAEVMLAARPAVPTAPPGPSRTRSQGVRPVR
jgi:hypothetical protein